MVSSLAALASASPEHFVELAIELASDRGRRDAWRAEIRDGAAKVLENDAVVRELETFVERVVTTR